MIADNPIPREVPRATLAPPEVRPIIKATLPIDLCAIAVEEAALQIGRALNCIVSVSSFTIVCGVSMGEIPNRLERELGVKARVVPDEFLGKPHFWAAVSPYGVFWSEGVGW